MAFGTGNPFGTFGSFRGGMRNPRMPRPMPRPMNRPPMNQYQMPPINQMPMRMAGGPSKGGASSTGGWMRNLLYSPMMQGPMPGGPGKGRLQDPFRRQTMQPQPFFGNTTAPQPFFGNPTSPQPDQSMGRPMPQPFFGNPTSPQPDLTGSGGLGGMIGGDSDWSPMVSSADINIHGRPSVDNQGKFINNQTGEIRYGQPSQPMPYQPSFSGNTNRGGTSWGLQGPIRQESMTGNQQPLYGVTGGSFGQLGPTDPMQFPEQQPPTTPALGQHWGRSYPGGPVLQTAGLGNMEYTGRGFYGGGIMDLYPR